MLYKFDFKENYIDDDSEENYITENDLIKNNSNFNQIKNK